MRIFCIFLLLLMALPGVSEAQRPPSQISDSIIMTFHRDFGKVRYEHVQLIEDVMSVEYFESENEEGSLALDSICCDVNGIYKFFKIRKSGNKVLAEYHTGSYGTLREVDDWSYYFDGGRLLQTIHLHHQQSADGIEDFGVYEYVEEKRVIFAGQQYPLYIYREGEGYSNQFSIGDVQFEQFDVKNLLYDKYMFETVGAKILAHDKNI